jgi:hypothetical protein
MLLGSEFLDQVSFCPQFLWQTVGSQDLYSPLSTIRYLYAVRCTSVDLDSIKCALYAAITAQRSSRRITLLFL